MTTEQRHSWWPVPLVIGLGVGLFAICLHGLNTFLNVDRAMEVYDLNGKETARLASTLFFSKMTAIAQLTVALLAGAWTLFTLGDVQIRVEGRWSMTCFAFSNMAFAGSLISYSLGYDFIVVRIFHHYSFDPDAPFINQVSNSQQLFFLHGLLSITSAIALGRKMN